MSMAPQQQDEAGVSLFDRTTYQIKKAVEKYFIDPLKYLFYGSLTITILGLFFGMKFSWQYYVILFMLGFIEGYKSYGK